MFMRISTRGWQGVDLRRLVRRWVPSSAKSPCANHKTCARNYQTSKQDQQIILVSRPVRQLRLKYPIQVQETQIKRTCPMPAPAQSRQSIEHYSETKERSDYTAYTPNELSNCLHHLFLAAINEIRVKAVRILVPNVQDQPRNGVRNERKNVCCIRLFYQGCLH